METTPFEDAIKAYEKYCKENGLVFSQPSEKLSVTDRKYVHLENMNGKLCKYEITTGKIIP